MSVWKRKEEFAVGIRIDHGPESKLGRNYDRSFHGLALDIVKRSHDGSGRDLPGRGMRPKKSEHYKYEPEGVRESQNGHKRERSLARIPQQRKRRPYELNSERRD